MWTKSLTLARTPTSPIIYQALLARTLLVDLNGSQATLLALSVVVSDQIAEKHEQVL